MKQLHPGVVVVTGAGSGIGRATAQAFAELGGEVVVADINLPAAAETVALIKRAGGLAHSYQIDVSSVAALEEFGTWVRVNHGVPDIVVNNAGIVVGGPFLDLDVADIQRIVDINLMAMIHGCRIFGAQMVERGAGGHLVNVASLAAYAPCRMTLPYSITKAGVKHFSECIRAELAAHRIGVTVVCPGLIGTNLAQTATIRGVTDEQANLGRDLVAKLMPVVGADPAKAAKAIVSAVRRNQAVRPIRAESWISYRLARWFPRGTRTVMRIGTGPELEKLGRFALAVPGVMDAGHVLDQTLDRLPKRRAVPTQPTADAVQE